MKLHQSRLTTRHKITGASVNSAANVNTLRQLHARHSTIHNITSHRHSELVVNSA